MYATSHLLFTSWLAAGMIVSTVGGFIATVLVQRLAAGWWGEEAGRRVVIFFCLFPGAIVFSMVYSEGVLIPLIAGCFLALERRRWVLAGLLGGVSTAVAPVAIAVVPACAVAALLEIRRRGWRDREARRALWAPLLSPFGLALFAVFMWFWTGSPLASYTAQHHGWSERTTLFSLVHVAQHLIDQIADARSLSHPGINLNYISGLLGAAFLAWAIVLLLRTRPRIPAAPIVYVAGNRRVHVHLVDDPAQSADADLRVPGTRGRGVPAHGPGVHAAAGREHGPDRCDELRDVRRHRPAPVKRCASAREQLNAHRARPPERRVRVPGVTAGQSPAQLRNSARSCARDAAEPWRAP